MGCVELLQSLDVSCHGSFQKYYQQIILINRDYVDQYLIQADNEKHRISFNLLPNKSGNLFKGTENGSQFDAFWSKSEDNGFVLYRHNAQLPIVGIGEEIKILCKQLDNADYFAAIQFRDGTIEIYGFENGLTTNDYEFRLQNTLSGSSIGISSKYDELQPPFVYYAAGLENEHFDNLFANIPEVLTGDFNLDFNNDFYIGND